MTISTVKVVRHKLVCDGCSRPSELRPSPRALFEACGAEGWCVLLDARGKCLASHCPSCTRTRGLTPGCAVHLVPRASRKRSVRGDEWARLFRGGMSIPDIAHAAGVRRWAVQSALKVRGLFTTNKTRRAA